MRTIWCLAKYAQKRTTNKNFFAPQRKSRQRTKIFCLPGRIFLKRQNAVASPNAFSPNAAATPLYFSAFSTNFLSYSSAALSTTRTEPTLWTIAPVIGVSRPSEESRIATALIVIESEMLNFIVRIVAFASTHRYGSFSMSSPMCRRCAAWVLFCFPPLSEAGSSFAATNLPLRSSR